MLTSSQLYAAGYEAAVRGKRPDGSLWQWCSYRDGFRHGGEDDAMLELRPGRQWRRHLVSACRPHGDAANLPLLNDRGNE